MNLLEKLKRFLDVPPDGRPVPSDEKANVPDLRSHKNRVSAWCRNTPFFLTDQSIVKNRLNRLKKVLQKQWGPSAVAFSFKTNTAVAKARVLTKADVWAEVVSTREYAIARQLGFRGDRIVFNGPVKKDSDLQTAVRNGSIIHLDNDDELARFMLIARRSNKPVSAGLRVHGKIEGLDESRFGFSIENGDAKGAVQKISSVSAIRLQSLHMHIGTDIDNKTMYAEAASKLGWFCRMSEGMTGRRVHSVDIGGGFPSSSLAPFGREDWAPESIETYIETIAVGLKKHLSARVSRRLIVEPGRYLVDDAIVYVTRVHDQSMKGRLQKILTDGAVTMLPLVYYRPQIVRVFDSTLEEKTSPSAPSIIYGGSCKEDDVMHENSLPLVETGDYVVYYCVGAYNQSMGSDFIFGTPPMHIV